MTWFRPWEAREGYGRSPRLQPCTLFVVQGHDAPAIPLPTIPTPVTPEAYDVLRVLGGLSNDDMAKTFDEWNKGELQSFLIEISAIIMAKKVGAHVAGQARRSKANKQASEQQANAHIPPAARRPGGGGRSPTTAPPPSHQPPPVHNRRTTSPASLATSSTTSSTRPAPRARVRGAHGRVRARVRV